jgi:hypothetical protein
MIPLNSQKCHVEVLKFEVAMREVVLEGGADNHSRLWGFQILQLESEVSEETGVMLCLAEKLLL